MTRPTLTEYQLIGAAFEVDFYEGALRLCPLDPEVMAGLASAYTAIGRYEDGLVMDRMLVSLVPNDATVRYNLACSLSLTGQLESSLQELFKAAALGYKDVRHLLEDPDLVAVREHPLWPRVLDLIRERQSGKSGNFKSVQLGKPWVDTLKEVEGKDPNAAEE